MMLPGSSLEMLTDYPRLLMGVAFLAGFLVYYIKEVAKKPQLACRPGKLSVFLQENLPILQETYWPTLWCFESRAQTIFASVFRKWLPRINYKREVLRLSDGGEVCLDWLENKEYRGDYSKEPTVIFLPGLTGHSQSDYIKSLITAARKAGARCVVFSNRGLGGIDLKTARTYCAANSEDLGEVIDHVKTRYPDSPLMVTGISLGGMITGNYLVTNGKKATEKLVAAMIVSAVWDVHQGTASLERPVLNLMLNYHLASDLCQSVKQMRSQLFETGPWASHSVQDILKSRTIREFDARFTAKQFGFKDIDDYYTAATLRGRLGYIKVPVLCLNAVDDPMQPGDGIPLEEAEESSHVAFIVTARGGHIGFMEGFLPVKEHFVDRLFAQYVKAVFEKHDALKDI